MALLLISVGIFWGIVLGLPIGIAAAVVLLWRFRARVARSMRDTARQTPTESMEIGVPAPPVEGRYKAELAIDIARPQEVLASLAGGSVTAAAAKRQARRVALVYGAAASVFALILVIVFHRFVGGFNPTGSLDRVILLHALWFAIFFMIFFHTGGSRRNICREKAG